MRLIRDAAEFQAAMLGYRARNLRVGFVPTMGYLHAGHQSLMAAARAESDVVAVSIFVNPKQFGPSEDLARYPRDLDGDLKKCAGAKVDVVFAPEADGFYAPGFQTQVEVLEATQGLCGASRPTHFRGVTTVVLKLLMLAQPTAAFFGEKDFQQLTVIQTMVRDLSVPMAIVGVPTMREPDGLAMSSRNVFLAPDERKVALVLKRSLDAMIAAAAKGERSRETLLQEGRAVIAEAPSVRLDYLELVDARTLKATDPIAAPTRGIGAIFVGKTRLIDNCAIL
ncbi:MAG: pantoate--beta-alanine ligase [Deltaproteobacteria bacterium]|nr:pantoate--beta-alanine ligase [Deltaproteobacteria bacterium]